MLEQLTQKQQWGFAYVAKKRNDSGVVRSDWTADEIAVETLASAGDRFYAEIESVKWGLAKQMFDALTTEQQNAILAQFGIPPILIE